MWRPRDSRYTTVAPSRGGMFSCRNERDSRTTQLKEKIEIWGDYSGIAILDMVRRKRQIVVLISLPVIRPVHKFLGHFEKDERLGRGGTH